MAKNLTELAERTATADTDLMHINSGGTDYKETKENFIKNLCKEATFNNTSTLTSQIDALPVGNYYGFLLAYGHQTETEMPENSNFYVEVQKYDSNNVKAYAIVRGTGLIRYKNGKANSWGTWVKEPTRSEMNNIHISNRIFRHKEIPTTVTAYDCAWQNYYFLIIQAVQWGNIRNSIVVDTSMFSQMTSGARPQILDPISNVTYEVYPNGNGSIYAITTSGTSTSALGLDIYGVMAK